MLQFMCGNSPVEYSPDQQRGCVTICIQVTILRCIGLFSSKSAGWSWDGDILTLPNGLATPSPDSQTKSCQTEPDEKVAGSVWLPGPEVWRKLEGSWPDCTRQRQNFTLITKRDRIWCCLAQSGQLPSIFLQIFGPGNQIEPAIFCLAPSGLILSGCLGLGVARAWPWVTGHF